MKLFIIASLLFVGFTIGVASAQAPAPPSMGPPQPTAADLENQMAEIGCKAERQAAASTIVQLKQQITDLQKQVQKLDPPKSGATKH